MSCPHLRKPSFLRAFNRANEAFARRALLLVALPAMLVASTVFVRADAQPARVVATFSVLQDLVKDVARDTATLVDVLVPAGSDSHTFEPSPSLAVAVTNASVIFEIGAGFEPWLDALVNASGAKAQRVTLSSGIDLIRAEAAKHDGEHDHADAHGHKHDDHAHRDEGHAHGEFDPHIWSDPVVVAGFVPKIADALAAADPPNAATYRANAEALIARLNALDHWIQEQVATVPEDRRKLVTTHDTFSYFARRYGFTVVGSVLHSVSTEAHDPSAADSVRLVNRIRSEGVRAVFPDVGENTQLLASLAQAAGMKVGGQLYPDTLSDKNGPVPTYEAMIRHNVTTIVDALR